MDYLKITITILLFTNLCLSQNNQTKMELERKIIGTWYLEGDSISKFVFDDNSKAKRFNGDKLARISHYAIVKTCGKEKLSENEFFLKEIYQNGAEACFYIESLDYDGNGIFSMMTKSQGKVVVLKKQNQELKEQ